MVLNATATLTDGQMKFECTAGDGYKIVTDYPAPHGSGGGPTSLELFLASLCSCLGGTLAVLLRQAGKTVDAVTVSARGERRKEHPTCFERIELTAKINAPDAQSEDVAKALKLAETCICPVAAMVKNTVALDMRAELLAGRP